MIESLRKNQISQMSQRSSCSNMINYQMVLRIKLKQLLLQRNYRRMIAKQSSVKVLPAYSIAKLIQDQIDFQQYLIRTRVSPPLQFSSSTFQKHLNYRNQTTHLSKKFPTIETSITDIYEMQIICLVTMLLTKYWRVIQLNS